MAENGPIMTALIDQINLSRSVNSKYGAKALRELAEGLALISISLSDGTEEAARELFEGTRNYADQCFIRGLTLLPEHPANQRKKAHDT